MPKKVARLDDLPEGATRQFSFQRDGVRVDAFVANYKGEIRALSDALGLPTADKPQMPCLSSRIPYGQVVTPEKLAMIEQAEGVLRDAGFREVRVRHHDQPGGALARLELGQAEIKRFVAEGMMETVSLQIREAGFTDVTLDTKGYRRGSLNEGLPKEALANG